MHAESLPFPLPEQALVQLDDLPFPRVASGKVREIFDLGDAFLMVATDRVSAFDVVFNEGVPGKGVLLTQISLHWFAQAGRLVRHHLVEDHEERVKTLARAHPKLAHRSMVVKKLAPLPIEAVVRGYLAGSGWKAYKETGRLFEYPLPPGLRENERLPEPLFTPTTKEASGHDAPVACAEAGKLIGEARLSEARDLSLRLYRMGMERAEATGLILADTKFEFGTDTAGGLYLIDEVFTPDSSRYWPMDAYAPGETQPSFDKQYVRDYLETLDWDKCPPPPQLPDFVIEGTRARYIEAYRKITGFS
ncbi:MAG: phosphoribosylaminoimidazolesuccinocarboxamide synthase [Opitutales bacterium]